MAYQSIHSGANVDAAVTRALAGGAIDQEMALKAPIASPALTGTPTAPTPAANDNSTKIATTEYADKAILASMITESVGPSAIASFSDGADGVALKSATFSIEPTQDLNGQDYPYPAGGGANIWNEAWQLGSIGSSGQNTDSTTAIRSTGYTAVQPETSYYFHIGYQPSGGIGMNIFFYDSTQAFLSRINGPELNNAVFTTPANCAYVRFNLSSTYGTNYRNDIAINYPSSVTAYSPHENVCPISGWTGANIYRTDGNNLLSGKTWTIGSYYNDSGAVVTGGTTKRMNAYIPVTAGQPYMLSCSNNPTIRIRVHEYDANQNWLRQIYSDTGESATWTASSDEAYIRMSLGRDATDIICSLGNVYPISWQDEAGTVCGGTLQYLGGGAWRLTKTHGTAGYGNVNNWTAYSNSGLWYVYRTFSAALPGGELIADKLKPLGVVTGASNLTGKLTSSENTGKWCIAILNSSGRVYVGNSLYTTADYTEEQFIAAVNSIVCPFNTCFELAAPTTYDLATEQVIATLKGSNAIWSDTGDAAVEYRADTKLYIDNAIASI